MAEDPGHAVQGVVLGCYYKGLADAGPVEAGVEDGLHEIAVGGVVGPGALALEACQDGVVAQALSLRSRLCCTSGALMSGPSFRGGTDISDPPLCPAQLLDRPCMQQSLDSSNENFCIANALIRFFLAYMFKDVVIRCLPLVKEVYYRFPKFFREFPVAMKSLLKAPIS